MQPYPGGFAPRPEDGCADVSCLFRPTTRSLALAVGWALLSSGKVVPQRLALAGTEQS